MRNGMMCNAGVYAIFTNVGATLKF